MQRLFLTMTLLVSSFCASAQNTVQLDINKETGDFTNHAIRIYYSEYATHDYSDIEKTPGVRIQHWGSIGGHWNNIYFYDNMNLGLYSSITNPNENYEVKSQHEYYRIYPSQGYYISAFSLDFIPGKHPIFPMNGVRMWIGDNEASAVTSLAEDVPGHLQAEFSAEDYSNGMNYIVLTVGMLAEGGNPIFAHTNNFKVTLTKIDEDGISDVYNGQQAISVFDLYGRKQSKLQRGMNIIRTSDGITHKVLVRTSR